MSKPIKKSPLLFRERRGAALGEYGIILGLIGLASVASIASLGERVSKSYEDIAENVDLDNAKSGATEDPTGEPDVPAVPPGDIAGDDTTFMHIALGETVRSDLEDDSDRDWFRVTIPQTANVHINAREFAIDGQGTHYLRIDFRRLDGSRIDYETHTSSVDLVVNEVPAGDYFVDISSYRSNDFGGYELEVNLVDDITNTHGPSSQAHTIGSTNQSDILPGDRGDSFVFDVSQLGDYVFEASGNGPSAMKYIELEIRNDSGDRLGHETTADDSKIMLNDLEVGRYYARVRGYRDGAVGAYVFASRSVDDVPGTISEAEPYSMGSVATKEIFTSDDVDRFSFTATGGEYTFTLSQDGASPLFYLEVSIRDASDVKIAEARGSKGAALTILDLPAGGYTARVRGYRGSTGGYTFQGQKK